MHAHADSVYLASLKSSAAIWRRVVGCFGFLWCVFVWMADAYAYADDDDDDDSGEDAFVCGVRA